MIATDIKPHRVIKERPILFSAPMVRAILEGTKTQTRRIIKPQPTIRSAHDGFKFLNLPGKGPLWQNDSEHHCPYGKPGDRLWVRETFCSAWTDSSHITFAYKATDDVDNAKWKPSIHMPRIASRILLEIIDIRVERLAEIGEKDARAEGVAWKDYSGTRFYHDYVTGRDIHLHAKSAFYTLWESINGPESWKANPWVWVVEFKPL